MTPTTTLVPRDGAAPPPVTAEQMDLIQRTIAQGATADELRLYLYDCARQGVHPLDKLIHFTKRGGKYTPITSIDFLRIRASETGDYAGNDDPNFSYTKASDVPELATVTVFRLVHGQRCPFTATARWKEYYPGDQSGHMWKRMPHTMLGKCAEALALRKGFPRQLAGLYVQEELDQAAADPFPRDAPPAAPQMMPANPPSVISESQRKRLFAIAKEHNWSKEQLKAFLAGQGYDSSTTISWADYDRVIAAIERGPAVADTVTRDDVPFSK